MTTKEDEKEKRPANALKILIIDDDQFLLSMYSQKFNQAGIEVETETGGEKALAKLRGGYKPDLIILDLIMPAMNGLDVLTEIRKEKLAEEAAVVVLTNEGQSEEIERGKKLGIQGYIIKATSIPSEVLHEVSKIAEDWKKKLSK